MSRFLSIRCLIIIIVSMLTSAAFACPHIVTANGINKPSVIHINEPVTFSIGSAVCDRCFIPSNGYSWTVEDATIIGIRMEACKSKSTLRCGLCFKLCDGDGSSAS